MTQPVLAPEDALTDAVNRLLKPGSKTTEFLGLLAVYAGAVVALLGLVDVHNAKMNAVIKVAALIAAAISHVGYALSRGDAKQALASAVAAVTAAGIVVPVTSGKHAKPSGDSGAVDLVGLVAGVLVIAGLIWLVVGFTHHALDVFGLILLLVGLGIYFLFGGWGTRYLRRRP